MVGHGSGFRVCACVSGLGWMVGVDQKYKGRNDAAQIVPVLVWA